MDQRRGRWIAFDASFYDNSVGVMLREKYGTAGLTVFSAFLCACKRNMVQGQIEYGTEADALAQMGLPGLELRNEMGEPFSLQELWRSLAAHKQITTSTRGRRKQIKSSNWTKWQEGYRSQTEAQRKSRSRAMNTPDNASPKQRRKVAVTSPETETDSETDIIISGATNHRGEPPSAPDDDDEISPVDQTLALMAERRIAAAIDGGLVIQNLGGYRRRTLQGLNVEFGDEAVQLLMEGESPQAVADKLVPHRSAAANRYPTFEPGKEPAWDEQVIDGVLVVRRAG